MTVAYRQPGLTLMRGTPARDLVQALQRDLRRLGYHRGGLDGIFGAETEVAVKALQRDLLVNDGVGRHGDGDAPVAIRDFNRNRVDAVNGILDQNVAACVDDLLNDPRIPPLPHSEHPADDNASVVEAIRGLQHQDAPIPFLLAILSQESNFLHFRVPTPTNPDDFIVVGLDHNDPAHPDRVTSRGYGIGQYTLFHHPPRADEVAQVMLDPIKNAARAIRELRDKFDGFILGAGPNVSADDRIALRHNVPLKPCRYDASDPRYQVDCRRCALDAPRVNIRQNDPVYPGAVECLVPTRYHPETHYDDLPDWTTFDCDWPYAVRRYNGSGINSYHYQAQVLGRFLHDGALARLLSP